MLLVAENMVQSGWHGDTPSHAPLSLPLLNCVSSCYGDGGVDRKRLFDVRFFLFCFKLRHFCRQKKKSPVHLEEDGGGGRIFVTPSLVFRIKMTQMETRGFGFS